MHPAFFLVDLLIIFSSYVAGISNEAITNATFGTVYNTTVNHREDKRFIYRYNITDTSVAVRIHAQSSNASTIFPVLFVVKQQKSVLSWAIPTLLLSGDSFTYDYGSIGRTLCPEQTNQTAVKEILVDVSTMNYYSTQFELDADLIDILITDKVRNVSVSPAKSQFFRYDFPANVSSVTVKAQSDDDLCAVFSLQEARCPVYDMVGTVEHVGYRQTITRRGAFTVKRQTFAGASFFIVVVVKPNDLDCQKFQKLFSLGMIDSRNRRKIINIDVQPTMSDLQFYLVIFLTLGIFLLFYIVAFIMSFVWHVRNKSALSQVDSEDRSLLAQTEEATRSYGTMSVPTETTDAASNTDKVLENVPSYQESDEVHSSASSSIDLRTTNNRGVMPRTKTCLCVADLARKPREILAKKYNLYVWNLITLAIFYVLPVIQLVITYQMVVNKTGDDDICYYNFYCAYQVGFLSSFNNVYSNIGYVTLGILFVIIVYRRQVLHEKNLLECNPNAQECGIPQHFGVFYAMGIALAMEGILSGCYHVCPSFNNFQFDTAFMYMIGWLCMLKIYQTRHPDVNAGAHTAYCAIAFLVFFGVIGVTEGSTAFWIVFVFIYVLCSFYLSINIYFVGRWRLRSGVLRGLYHKLRHENLCCSKPRDCSRLVLLVLGNSVNIGLAIFGAIRMPKDFASYLLAIVIFNLLMYFAFYIIMKVRCGEKILFWAGLYIFLAAAVWGVALYFFMKRLTSWQMTPAMSRESNENCVLLDFYDSHDIWHFLSAISLFLSFMVLLVLEDDLADVPRDSISVF